MIIDEWIKFMNTNYNTLKFSSANYAKSRQELSHCVLDN